MKKIALFIVAAVILSGCNATRRSADKKKGGKNAATAQTDTAPAFTPDINATEASIKDGAFGTDPSLGLGVIYFDYDSASLAGDGLATLKKNAEILKARRDLEVLVAGHADERGTIEYNLALGQKRAKEVREMYIRLGVNGKQVATISYGEEQQVCSEATESCWAKNRRAETRTRSRVAKQK